MNECVQYASPNLGSEFIYVGNQILPLSSVRPTVHSAYIR